MTDNNEIMKRITAGAARRLNAGRLSDADLQPIIAMHAPGSYVDDDGVAKSELGSHLEEVLKYAIDAKAGAVAPGASKRAPSREEMASMSAEQKIAHGNGNVPPQHEAWRRNSPGEVSAAECAAFDRVTVEEFNKYPADKKLRIVGEVQAARMAAKARGNG